MTDKQPSTRAMLEMIHCALANAMLKRIEAAQRDGGGEPLAASEMSAIAKFLADNDVICSPDDPTLQSIADDLPFPASHSASKGDGKEPKDRLH